MRVVWVLGLLLPALAPAQKELSGRLQFPQFRTISALPGGTVPVDASGKVNARGALALSTPIAYSLREGQFVGLAGITLEDLSLRATSNFSQITSRSDGTAALLGGFRAGSGDLTIAGMVLSGTLDNVLNVQWSPRASWRNVRLGIGAQDLFSTGGTSGDRIDLPEGGGLSRSLYVVGTVALPGEIFASAGLGTGRFRNFYANASMPLGRAKFGVEWDGFNFNGGAYLPVGRVPHVADASIYVGAVRGKFLCLSFALAY